MGLALFADSWLSDYGGGILFVLLLLVVVFSLCKDAVSKRRAKRQMADELQYLASRQGNPCVGEEPEKNVVKELGVAKESKPIVSSDAVLQELIRIRKYLKWCATFLGAVVLFLLFNNTSSLLRSIDRHVRDVDDGVRTPREYRGEIRPY